MYRGLAASGCALLDERGGDVYAPFSPDAGKIYLPGWKVVELKGNEDLR